MKDKRTMGIDGKKWHEVASYELADDCEMMTCRANGKLTVYASKPERSPLDTWQAENIREPESPKEISRRTAEWLVEQLELYLWGRNLLAPGMIAKELRRLIGRGE